MANEQTIYVRHNAEIAHRLSQLPGKCQQIHGHSLQIRLEMQVWVNGNGIGCVDREGLLSLDFGQVKKQFRRHIDETYDHRLLLNERDTLLSAFDVSVAGATRYDGYPGLKECRGDPTIENISRWIGEWSAEEFGCPVTLTVDETNTNGASWSG